MLKNPANYPAVNMGVDYASSPGGGIAVTLVFYNPEDCHPLPERKKLMGVWGDSWRFCYYYPMRGGSMWGVYDGQGGLMETPPPDWWAFIPDEKPE
jgi:hypothetical protein